MKTIVERVSLPESWAENMLRELDKESAKAKTTSQATVRCLGGEKSKIEKKLEELPDLRLEGALDTAEYLQKKNTLVSRKLEIGQKVRDSERRGGEWLEPMRDLVLKARQAKTMLSNGKAEELPTFLRNVGSNFLLKGNTLQWEAKRGWRVLAHGGPFATWWPRPGSNW